MAKPRRVLLVALSHATASTLAFTHFDTTCTPPATRVDFVSSPDARGTLEILWSCLFSIFACTWTIQHLNIPRPRGVGKEHDDSAIRRMWSAAAHEAKSFWSSLKWMLLAVVAPEFLLGKAIGDYVLARRLKREVDEMREAGTIGPDEEWELSHSFFSFMGGFRLCGVQAHGDNPDGNINDKGPRVATAANSRIMPPQMLLQLRKMDVLPSLPDITKQEIHDKSKTSFFVKAVTVLQVFWVCVQVIVRAVSGLAISQLELMAAAFAACSLVSYVFLIPKPQGVNIPMRPIPISGGLTSVPDGAEWVSLRGLAVPGLEFKINFDVPDKGVQAIPNDSIPGGLKDLGTYAVSMSVGGAIFGSIHVAGWNLEFPTGAEQELWRICSLIITCLLPIAFLPFIAMIILEYRLSRGMPISPSALTALGFRDVAFQAVAGFGGDPGGDVSFYDNRVSCSKGGTLRIGSGLPAQVWGLLFGLVYLVARLFLLVETFRTLAFLPPDVFVTTWVSVIPSLN